MGQHTEQTRQALLDAAEELFARDGIDAVSNRRIAEHAGTANHSAVAYHFGTKDELLHELVRRSLISTEARRYELIAALGSEGGLREIVTCRILPFVEQLEALASPSWRAQFLEQASAVPSVAAAIAEAVMETRNTGMDELRVLTRLAVADVSEVVLHSRSSIVGQVVLRACANYERSLAEGRAHGTWTDVGYFLIDVAVGILSAPVTPLGERFAPPLAPDLV